MRWLMLFLNPDHNKNTLENILSEHMVTTWQEAKREIG
jgi:hypothetical protein